MDSRNPFKVETKTSKLLIIRERERELKKLSALKQLSKDSLISGGSQLISRFLSTKARKTVQDHEPNRQGLLRKIDNILPSKMTIKSSDGKPRTNSGDEEEQ